MSGPPVNQGCSTFQPTMGQDALTAPDDAFQNTTKPLLQPTDAQSNSAACCSAVGLKREAVQAAAPWQLSEWQQNPPPGQQSSSAAAAALAARPRALHAALPALAPWPPLLSAFQAPQPASSLLLPCIITHLAIKSGLYSSCLLQ